MCIRDRYDVLAATANQVCARANAMRGSSAGRGKRVTHALDLVGGGQRCGNGRAHRARHHVRAHLADAALAQQVGGFNLPFRRTTTGACDQAGTRIADLCFVQARIGNRIAHGDMGEGGGIAQEAFLFAVDFCFQVDLWCATDVTTEAELGIFGNVADTGTTFAQGAGNRVGVIAQAGSNAQAGDGDATHVQKSSVEVNRPTRRSLAV